MFETEEGYSVELLKQPYIDFKYEKTEIKEANGEFLENIIKFSNETEIPTLFFCSGKYKVTFPIGSVEHKVLVNEGKDVFEHSLKNGAFLFVEGQLVEYQTSQYFAEGGYCRTEDDIKQLAMMIGLEYVSQKVKNGSFKSNLNNYFNNFRKSGASNYTLGAKSFDMEVELPEMKEGGHFNVKNRFNWSAFSPNIGSSIEVERLICLNGMVSNNPLVSNEIRIINEWEEHLEVAKKALNHSIYHTLESHFNKMKMAPASVHLINTINNHAEIRLKALGNRVDIQNASERRRLEEIYSITSREKVYDFLRNTFGEIKAGENIFETRLGNDFGSHLTLMDAWNITTEMATHTSETAKSKDHFLNSLANKIVFDSEYKINTRTKENFQSSFSLSDVERDFFGQS